MLNGVFWSTVTERV